MRSEKSYLERLGMQLWQLQSFENHRHVSTSNLQRTQTNIVSSISSSSSSRRKLSRQLGVFVSTNAFYGCISTIMYWYTSFLCLFEKKKLRYASSKNERKNKELLITNGDKELWLNWLAWGRYSAGTYPPVAWTAIYHFLSQISRLYNLCMCEIYGQFRPCGGSPKHNESLTLSSHGSYVAGICHTTTWRAQFLMASHNYLH